MTCGSGAAPTFGAGCETVASTRRPPSPDGAALRVQSRSRRPKILAVIATVLVAASAGEAMAQVTGLNPTAAELAQLPRFCMRQLGGPNAAGADPGPVMCGPGTNHYCPGLVWLIRAKATRDIQRKKGLLMTAANDVRYTEEWIAKYPNCSIRRHVQETRAEIEALQRAFSVVPGRSK